MSSEVRERLPDLFFGINTQFSVYTMGDIPVLYVWHWSK